jgi:hypothetical protein
MATVLESDIDSENPMNIREGSVSASDLALENDLGKKNLLSVNFLLFNERKLAYQKADKILKEVSYPAQTLSAVFNRSAYKLEVGDYFKFSYDQYGISERVFRVISLKDSGEGNPDISVEAIEALDYLSASIPTTEEPQANAPDFIVKTIEPLLAISVYELPYSHAGGENFQIIPLVGRQTRTETGFYIYYSIDDGVSYNFLKEERSYSFFGTSWGEPNVDGNETFDTENTVSVLISNYAQNKDVDLIDEVTADQMFLGENLAIIGTEVFSYKKIEQSSGSIYNITGVSRGLYGSTRESTWTNKTIRFLLNKPETISNERFYHGNTVFFKFVPYDLFGVGDISEAYTYTYTFSGTALTPLKPHRVKADNYYGTGEWTEGNDIVFTWESSLRGYGAGTEGMSSELRSLSGEGLYRLEIYKDSVLYRTVTDLSSQTYTYTDANIYSDFSSTYPDYFEVRIYNYILNADGNTYTSEYENMTINKAF